MLDSSTVVDFIKNFGFPIAVAVWALWKLDKSWSQIDQSLDQIQEILTKNTEIQNEMVTTIKILHTIISMQGNSKGDKRDDS